MKKDSIKKLITSLKPYQPQKIILFGSAALGKAKPGSDLDILIIKKTKEPFWERQRRVTAFIKTDVSVDAFVLTPQEFKKSLRQVQPFIYDVAHQGRVIYEQTK